MATSLINTINTHAFGWDPLWVVLDGSNRIETLGADRQHTVEFLESTTAGDTIVVVFNGQTITFTCASSPDDSGLQFAPGGSAAIAASNFRACLRKNADIMRHYQVSGTGVEFTLSARVVGSAWNTGIGSTPGTRIGNVSVTSGTDDVVRPNYRIGLRLTLGTTGWSEPIAEMSAAPDATGQVKFNLSPYLGIKDRLRATLPTLGMTAPISSDFHVYLWSAYAYEMYGEPPTARELLAVASEANPKTVWHGTLRHEDRANAQALFTEITDSGGSHPFLTWRGRRAKRTTTRTEQHWLGWYYWDDTTDTSEIQMQARVHFSDGTSSSWTSRYDATGAIIFPFQVGIFPAGWTELDLNALVPGGSTPIRYELRLWSTANNSALSETKTFYLRTDDYAGTAIWYENSLGCMESLLCKGQWSLGAEALHEELQQTLGTDPATHESERIYEPLGSDLVLRVSTGWMPRWEVMAVAEVLNARTLKWLDQQDPDNPELRALTPNKLAARIVERGHGTNEHLYALNLEFTVGDPAMGFSQVQAV